MNRLTAGSRVRRKQLMVVELVAKVVLAFAIGLATSIALAGVVLLLAHDVQAAELQAMKPKEAQQGTLLLKSEGSTLAMPAVATEAEIMGEYYNWYEKNPEESKSLTVQFTKLTKVRQIIARINDMNIFNLTPFKISIWKLIKNV